MLISQSLDLVDFFVCTLVPLLKTSLQRNNYSRYITGKMMAASFEAKIKGSTGFVLFVCLSFYVLFQLVGRVKS